MGATSEHFSNAELSCHHCGKNECQQILVDALEVFRKMVNRAVLVDDAYRCLIHNAAVGGAPKSEHMLGLAADIRVPGFSASQLESIARLIPTIKGIGRGDAQGYIHIDCRPTAAKWCYNAAGHEVPYYAPDLPAPA